MLRLDGAAAVEERLDAPADVAEGERAGERCVRRVAESVEVAVVERGPEAIAARVRDACPRELDRGAVTRGVVRRCDERGRAVIGARIGLRNGEGKRVRSRRRATGEERIDEPGDVARW